MAGKRYYWLKLQDEFFNSKRIKKLRRMAGGDTYTIIYLKMQLKAMKTDGVLTWTGLEENFADELALDLDESEDDVKVTLAYLLSCGLAESSDNVSFFFPYAVENTGSEASSTQRSRACRERMKVLQCNTTATQLQHDCNGEKEIEKDREIEKETDITNATAFVCRTKDVRRIAEAWNLLGLTQIKNISADSQRGKLLRARVNQNGVEAVIQAIERIRLSPYLQGQNKSGWQITFDWFVKPGNFQKVSEGNYDDRKDVQTDTGTGNIFLQMMEDGTFDQR